ncbi:MAG: DUF4139 domain-containing protein [Lentisphaeria bacterium]|nr:DUF4139 domain-containing protein [Lentisphaeria bacterium]
MKSLYAAGIVLFVLSAGLSAQVVEVTGKSDISAVTLYRNQAMVSRQVTVGDETGELAVVVENLPATIQPDSLFATSDALNIRSVRFLTEYVTQEDDDKKDEASKTRKELKTIRIALEELQPERELIRTKARFIQQLETRYLAELGPSATALTKDTLTQTGFDFETIETMTAFIFAQQKEMAAASLELTRKERELNEQADALNEKLAKLGYQGGFMGNQGNNSPVAQQREQLSPPQKILRKAMVYVAKKKAGNGTLVLHYLVNGSGWNPTYNMRIEKAAAEKLEVEYLAHVQQLTGEDWNSVRLTLSTATPNMNADIPMLAPMWVRLVPSDEQPSSTVGSISGGNLLVDNKAKQVMLNAEFQQIKGGGKAYSDYNFKLNDMAVNRQSLEFNNRKDVLKNWYQAAKRAGAGIAVEYQIPDTVTLASRRDNQMVRILTAPVEGLLFYEAVPLLSEYVSRGMEAKNTLNQPLLAGRYSAFIDGQYVGSGNLPLTVSGQMLSLGFGSEPQLKCSRELKDKTGDKGWGRRTETYTYEFTVDNYMDTAVDIRLLDRIPVTKNEGLKITLKQGADRLSNDEEYREFEYAKGILRWDMTLPPASSGSKATAFQYSFDVKFDSDMKISTEGETIRQQVEADLMEMQMHRMKK